MCWLLRITTTENRTLNSLEYDFFITLRRKGYEKKKIKNWFELFKLLSSFGTWMKYIHWILSNQTQCTWCSYWCLTPGLPPAGIIDSMTWSIRCYLFIFVMSLWIIQYQSRRVWILLTGVSASSSDLDFDRHMSREVVSLVFTLDWGERWMFIFVILWNCCHSLFTVSF
jgi:hypothetical protein